MGMVLRFDLCRWLKRPIDGGRTFRGRRLFGDGKTWRGVVVAVVVSIASVAIQKHLLRGAPEWLCVVDYTHTNAATFGTAMGAGAMLGELPNSFVKRRLDIARGATTKGPLSILFYVWDQIDLLTTAWPAVSFWVRADPLVVVASFLVAMGLHPIVSLLGFLIGARRSAR